MTLKCLTITTTTELLTTILCFFKYTDLKIEFYIDNKAINLVKEIGLLFKIAFITSKL